MIWGEKDFFHLEDYSLSLREVWAETQAGGNLETETEARAIEKCCLLEPHFSWLFQLTFLQHPGPPAKGGTTYNGLGQITTDLPPTGKSYAGIFLN